MSTQEFDQVTETYSQIFDQSFQNRIDLYKDIADSDWDDFPYFDEVKSLKDKQKKLMWNNFNKHIFAVFWLLELQDISLPSDMYSTHISQK